VPPEAPVDYGMYFSFLHPEDRERTHQAVQWAMHPESGGCFEFEFRILRIQDGVERWISSQGHSYFDDKGQPMRFIGTVLDCIMSVAQDNGSLRRVASAHREPAMEDFILASTKFGPGAGGTSPLLEVVRTGRSSLVQDFTPELPRHGR
jgi:hypothetical protein